MIPTAEEFLLQKYNITNVDYIALRGGNVTKVMIEFTKLHVEAALREASEKAEIEEYKISGIFYVEKNSILNAYPTSNIK